MSFARRAIPSRRLFVDHIAAGRWRLPLDEWCLAPSSRRHSALERTAEHAAGHSCPQRLHRADVPSQGSSRGGIRSRLTEHFMPDDAVPTLIAKLRTRLDDLEAEKLAITRALRALEGPKRRSPRLNLRAALIESIAASPGSSASLLALEFGVSASTVAAHLREFEARRGREARARMGALTDESLTPIIVVGARRPRKAGRSRGATNIEERTTGAS